MKDHHEVIFTVIMIIFLVIIIFVIIMESNYNNNYHNRIVFQINGNYWMEEQCTIATKNGRYVSLDSDQKLIYKSIPDDTSQWWYVYDNSNTSIGTFRNNETNMYVTFATDVEGEVLTATQDVFDLSKVFTVTRNGEGYNTVTSPNGLFMTSVNSFISLEVFSEKGSQLIITPCK